MTALAATDAIGGTLTPGGVGTLANAFGTEVEEPALLVRSKVVADGKQVIGDAAFEIGIGGNEGFELGADAVVGGVGIVERGGQIRSAGGEGTAQGPEVRREGRIVLLDLGALTGGDLKPAQEGLGGGVGSWLGGGAGGDAGGVRADADDGRREHTE